MNRTGQKLKGFYLRFISIVIFFLSNQEQVAEEVQWNLKI
jgi:hypothetical protein